MALSVTRHAPSSATGRWWLIPEQDRPGLSAAAAAAARWEMLRGHELASFTAELFGGFPGAAQTGGGSGKVHLVITDRYLIGNEGGHDGFALPLATLCGMSLVPSLVPGEPAVRMRYRLDGIERTMIVRIHARRTWSFRREGQVERFLQVLGSRGVAGLAPVDPERRRRLAVTWDEARAFSGETTVWNGEASAPVGGWLGLDRAPCHTWLTTRALYWGMPTGRGINRLPLDEIVAAQTAELEDRNETPVVVIAMRDLAGDRLELSFVFDQPAAGINQRDRGAFATGLRSQGIDVMASAARPQPWSPAAYAAPSQRNDATREIGAPDDAKSGEDLSGLTVTLG